MDQQSFNSTRLSLAIGDLPLTPFGMKSPFANIIENENINQKQKRIEDKCHGLTKLSTQRNHYSSKNCNNGNLSPQIAIQAGSKFRNVNKIKRRKEVKNKITISEETISENIIDVLPASSIPKEVCKLSLRCSESYLSDIDDGSFVEFKEASGLPNNKVVRNDLYSFYTCSSQNETKFTTSSKVANTEVAFQKFVDKVANMACISDIKRKDIFLDKQAQEFPLNETVIVASKNMIVKNSTKSNIMNSTMKPFGIKASEELPDLSSLTLEEFSCQSGVNNINDAAVALPIKQKYKKDSIVHINSNDKCSTHVPQQSLISEDVSISNINESLTVAQRFAMYPSNYEDNVIDSNIINNQTPKFIEHCHENIEEHPVIDNDRIKEWILTSPFKHSSCPSHLLNSDVLSRDKLDEGDCVLSKEILDDGKHTSSISQNLQLQLSYDTAVCSDALFPNPNGTVITIAKVSSSPKENNLVSKPKVLRENSNSSSSGNLKSQESFATELCKFTKVISSSSEEAESLIYSSDEENIASALAVRRMSLSTPNLRFWENGKHTSKFSISKVQSVSKVCLENKNEGIHTSTKDQVTYSGNLKRHNFKSNTCLNQISDYTPINNFLDVSSLEETSKKAINRKALGFCSKESNYDLKFSSDIISNLVPSINKFGQKSPIGINETILICDSSSSSQSSLGDVTPYKNKSHLSKNFRDTKLYKKCDIISEKSNYYFDSNIAQRKINRRVKFPVFKLSSDSDDNSENCNLDKQNSRNDNSENCYLDKQNSRREVEILVSSNSENDFMKNKQSLNAHNTASMEKNEKDIYLSYDSDDDSVNCNLETQLIRREVDILVSSNSENDLVKGKQSLNKLNGASMEIEKDKYLSSDSDDNFDTYLKKWKQTSVKKTMVNKKNESKRKPKESSFVVDSDESGEGIEFYIQQIKRQPSPNNFLVKQNKGNNLDDNSKNNSEKGIDAFLKTSPYKGNLKKVSTFQLLSSDSESDNRASIFFSKKPKKNNVKLVVANQKLSDITLDTPSKSEMKINRPFSFLASLSLENPFRNAHPDSLSYLKNFKKNKEALSTYLYNFYNKHIFDNKLPKIMKITWNARLTKTAGLCYYQIDKSSEVGKSARIEMSVKVCDGPTRLRDTLIHELCHAATWIISGCKGHHGKVWKAWASKAMRTFPELPIIARCHSYEIKYKYTYRCVNCGYSYGRHSKSIDLDRKVCGGCKGKLELFVNHVKKSENSATTVQRTPNAFALFVKENYSVTKQNQTELKHGDVMKQLSEQFKSLKAK